MIQLLKVLFTLCLLLSLVACGNKDCENGECTDSNCENGSCQSVSNVQSPPAQDTPSFSTQDTGDAPSSPGSSPAIDSRPPPLPTGPSNGSLSDALRIQAQAMIAGKEDSSDRRIFCRFPRSYQRGSTLETSKFGPVGLVQQKVGIQPSGKLDRNTEAAIKRYQSENNLESNGCIDTQTWKSMFPQAAPLTILDQAIGLTFLMEGTDYDDIEKNYGTSDKSGMTWGPLGMTLASGEIQEILKASYEVAKEEIDAALSQSERTLFRNLSNATMDTGEDLNFTAIEGMIDKIANIAKVRHTFDVVAMRSVYSRLGPYDQYLRQLAQNSTVVEKDWAMMFDIATQTGKAREKSAAMRRRVPVDGSYSDLDNRRERMGDVVADMVLSRWKADRTLRNSAFYGRNDFVAESYGFRDKAIYSVERASEERNEETETLSIEGLELGN